MRSAARIAAAAALVASRLTGRQLNSLAEELRPRNVQEGYLVQRTAHSMLAEAGLGRQGGWKIGCTTRVMQAYLGVDVPTAGAMYLGTMWHGAHNFAVSQSRPLGVECEIAVRIGKDLPARHEEYLASDVAGAVVASMAAIEVVEDRYVDYRSLDTPTLVADDFFHHGCVLGAEVESFDVRELREVTATMAVNGVEIGRGIGSDILGEPLEVLAWLATHCSRFALPLVAGDVVLLGSLVQTHWVEPGDVVEVRNAPFGEVGASFVAGY